jgi:hypothetical protein
VDLGRSDVRETVLDDPRRQKDLAWFIAEALGKNEPEPDSAVYRAVGEHAATCCPDHPLRSLFPGLDEATGRVDDDVEISARLANVLRRWRGLEWHEYLDVTPAGLLDRRNCGVRSLGELLLLAWAVAFSDGGAGRSRTDPAGDRLAVVPDAPACQEDTDAPGPTSMTALPNAPLLHERALRRVIGWAAWERGSSGIIEALDLALTDPDTPDQVAESVGLLLSLDLRTWTTDLAPTYDPVAQVVKFWRDASETHRSIAEGRILALSAPATLEELGRQLGVTRERVRQHEAACVRALRRVLGPRRMSACRTASRLRAFLGTASARDALASTDCPLVELGLAPGDLTALTLLWLAGPYESRGDWLILRPAGRVIAETKGILRQATIRGPASLTAVEDALAEYGIPRREVHEWIVSVSSYRIDDDRVLYWGGSIADKAATVLSMEGHPMTATELHERTGGSSARSVASRLGVDPRFKRTGVRSWGLRDWDHDEYTGVADEIAQEIDRQGGAASLEHLVSHLSSTYGVAPASVRAYVSSPGFARDERGLVVVTNVSSPARRDTRPPHESRSVFMHDGCWAYRLRVTAEHLRGSGFPMSSAYASAIGLSPGETRVLVGDVGSVTITWNSPQPTFGSIRQHLLARSAAVGDICFIAITDSSASVTMVPKGVIDAAAGVNRLALEVGVDEGAGLPAVAGAVGLEPSASAAAVARRLQVRGEADLAALLREEGGEDALVLSLDSGRFVDVRWSR